ncbi:MAG TPA: SHOCT domain-containing protein [Acidimicrobiia bacterium]|nr:SHOCT domain-containing protein [Acidimicrobiia bacterium]
MGRTAVIAGTASAVGGRVQHRQQEKYAAQDQQQQPQYAEAPPAAPAAPSEDDQMAQLEKLGDLHAKGILTDEEFSAKKAQILGI